MHVSNTVTRLSMPFSMSSHDKDIQWIVSVD